MVTPHSARPCLMLLFTTTGYEAREFVQAAQQLGVDTVLGSDRCHVLDDPWQDGALPLRFEKPHTAAQHILDYARAQPLDAILPVGDTPVFTAALVNQALGLEHNDPDAAAASRNKFLMRQLLFWRLRTLLETPEIRLKQDEVHDAILVESFIPGLEVALEGLLTAGHLQVLALFDKPDPLDGPFFEETLYITPSRLQPETQDAIIRCTEQAARALGLVHGPLHAELRLNQEGPWILEVAARAIGGL